MMDKDALSALRRDLAELGKSVADCVARLETLERQAEEEAEELAAFEARLEVEAEPTPPLEQPVPIPAIPPSMSASVFVETPLIPSEPVPLIEAPSVPPVMSEMKIPARPEVRPERVREPHVPSIDFGYWLRRLGPKEDMSWEMALGTFWLPRLGMLIVVIGVAFGASLAYQYLQGRWWLPHLRVAIGYGLCAAFLGLGAKLEAKSREFARVLLAGGMALLYFVTYSTHFITYTRIIPWAPPVLFALAGISGLWFAAAQWRRSRLVAAGTTVLGHITIFLSTWTLVSPHPTSVGGLLLLSVGSAVFLLRNRWYHVAALGMVCSYANQALWMSRCPPSGRVIDFVMALSVVLFYFLIFSIAEMKAPEALRRRAVPAPFRNGFVAFNSGTTFLLGVAVMRHYPFSQERVWMFYFGFAAALFLLGEYYLRRLKNDPLHNLYFVKACAVGTLGLATYFDGQTLTLALSLQAVTLLASARRSNLVVSRVLAWGVAILALGQGFFGFQQSLVYASNYWGHAIPALLVVAAFAALAILYERTDWRSGTLKRARVRSEWREILWQLDLLDESPMPGLTQPMGGLLFPRFFAAGGVVLLTGYAIQMLPWSERGAVVSLAALLLLLSGMLFSARGAVEGGLLSAVAGIALWVLHGLERNQPWDTTGAYKHGLLCAFLVLGVVFLMSELTRVWRLRPPLAWANVALKDDPVCSGIALGLGTGLGLGAMSTACLFLPVGDKAVTLAAMALCTAGYASAVPAQGIGFASMILAVTTALAGIEDFTHPEQWKTVAVCVALAFGVALHSEPRYCVSRPGLFFHQLPAVPYIVYSVALLPLACHLAQAPGAPYDALGMALVAVAAALLTFVLHRRALACCALVVFIWAAYLWGAEFQAWNYRHWHAAGFVLAGLALVGERFFLHRQFFSQPTKNLVEMIQGEISDDPATQVRQWAPFAPQFLLVGLAWVILLYQGGHAEPQGWGFFCCALVSLYFLAHAAYLRVWISGVYAVVSAFFCTLGLAGAAYTDPMHSPDSLSLVAGFVGVIAFWSVCERGWVVARKRELIPDAAGISDLVEMVLVAIPSVLLLVMLERIPVLASYYLTISWGMAAVVLMGVSIIFSQPYYRYAGLAAFVPAVVRVAVWDTQNLQGVYRIAAWIVLGLILIAVGYGYVRARMYLAESRKIEDIVGKGAED